MADADSSLKQQFQLLQEQQQKRLLRRKQGLEAREKSSLPPNSTPGPATFGIDDDLNLKLADPPPKTSGYLSEELVQHLNDQIRELKDENSRVYKLLSERDFEIRQFKKKSENDKKSLSGSEVTNETAALKIVELSKKVREITAELESEKTKSRQLGKKCQDLQFQISSLPLDIKSVMKTDANSRPGKEDKPEVDVKAVQDKLRQTESKLADFRNQCASLKQELKVAHKVVTQEVGDNVNVQFLLNENSNWRGRAQQILGLQKKIEDLKYELENSRNPSQDGTDLDLLSIGNNSARRGTSDLKHREQLRKLEKERKESQEKTAAQLKALEEENNSIKQKLEAAKARNKVLANEMKSNKDQMKTLLQKGQHDDELVQALMKQQSTLQNMLESSTKCQNESKQLHDERLKELSMKTQQDTNIVERMKAIVSEKEGKVHQLEEEIKQLKLQHLQKAQKESTDSLFQPVTRWPPSPQAMTPDCVDVNFTVSSVSPPASRLSNRPISVTSDKRAQSGRESSRTVSPMKSNNLEKQTIAHLQQQCLEHKTLLQVAEVERDKLVELVDVIQRRLDESCKQYSDSQNELAQQRRKNVDLEKQIGKAKLDLPTNTKGSSTFRRTGVGSSRTSLKTSTMDISSQNEEDPENINVQELLTRLEIQQDENESIKMALHSTLKSKEEDLKVYTDMMEETKQIFLQALRQSHQNGQPT